MERQKEIPADWIGLFQKASPQHPYELQEQEVKHQLAADQNNAVGRNFHIVSSQFSKLKAFSAAAQICPEHTEGCNRSEGLIKQIRLNE